MIERFWLSRVIFCESVSIHKEKQGVERCGLLSWVRIRGDIAWEGV